MSNVFAYRGSFANALKKASNMQSANELGTIVLIDLGNNTTKAFRVQGNAVAKRMRAVGGECRKANHRTGNTVIFTPHADYVENMTTLRTVTTFAKSRNGKFEYVSAPFAEVVAAATGIVAANFHAPSATAGQPGGTRVVTRSNRSATPQYLLSQNIDDLYRQRCTATYPMPTIAVQPVDIRAMIVRRVRDYIRLNRLAKGLSGWDNKEFEFTWHMLWEDFDLENGTSLVSEHRQREADGVHESILELAEQQGLIENVYAYVCHQYYFEDIMPRLVYTPGNNQPASTTPLTTLQGSPEPLEVASTCCSHTQTNTSGYEAATV